jgi:1-acyl-sn-glycerol-3-phosphate acyltransferase
MAARGSTDLNLLRKIKPFVDAMRRYHRHEVHGLERVPATGGCLLVVNRSLAPYDVFLLLSAIYDHNGRVARPLIDRELFRLPGLGPLLETFGGVEEREDKAEALLAAGELVCVAPGGMREALRPSTEKYRVYWHHRLGFTRLALQLQTPVVLGICPAADDIYHVHANFLTPLLYDTLRLPLPIARGIGMTFLPRPVRLTHFLSRPLKPSPAPTTDEEMARAARVFHTRLIQAASSLMSGIDPLE